MEATSYGIREERSPTSEFDRLREVLAWAKDHGIEVTMDGQVRGVDYMHNPRSFNAPIGSSLNSWQIRRKLEGLIREGRIKSVQEEPKLNIADYKLDMMVPEENSERRIPWARVLVGASAASGLVYILSSYIQ